MKRGLTWIIILCVYSFSMPAYAEWIYAGPEGGNVECVQVDPEGFIYAGTTNGRIYRSVNQGNSWELLKPGLSFSGYVINSIQYTHSSPMTLYAGTRGVWGGGGIFESNDGGQTWTKLWAPGSYDGITAFLIDPGNPDIFLASTPKKLFRSFNHGKKWEEIPVPEGIEDIYSLAMLPRTPNTIFLGTYRLPYKTENGGDTWKKIGKGMKLDTHVFQLLFTPGYPYTLFSATCGWIYRSKNNGDSWTRYRKGLTNRRVQSIAINPVNPKMLVAGTWGGAYISKNSGKTWKLVTKDNLVVNQVTFTGNPQPVILLGSRNHGFLKSVDEGKTFRESNEGFYHHDVSKVIPDPTRKGKLYASVINAGDKAGLYASENNGLSWNHLQTSPKFNNIYDMVLDGKTNGRILAGTDKGIFWYNTVTRGDWKSSESSRNVGKIHVLYIPEHDKNTLVAGGNEGLFLSKNHGKIFTKMIAAKKNETFLSTCLSGNHVYAASNQALYVSQDNGFTWRETMLAPGKNSIQDICGDPLNPGSMLVGTLNGLYRLDPGTEKWQKLSVLNAESLDVSNVRYDPFNPDTILVTSYLFGGIYASNNGGKTWARFDSFLDPVHVLSLSFDPFKEGKIFLATSGQSVVYTTNYRQELQTR